jgi:TIGR03009 family protein
MLRYVAIGVCLFSLLRAEIGWAQLRQNDAGWQRGDQANGQAAPRQTTANPNAPQPPGQVNARAVAPPPPPFVLTPQEEAHLDEILILWEQQSSAIKTYKCEFARWEYGSFLGQRPEDVGKHRTKSQGELKYAAPDKGMFKVNSIELYDAKTGGYVKGGPENLEHWVCNGKSIFEINHKEKTRTERPLPPEMQGAAISDGPLPFVFGAKAGRLKQRYWMKDITPKDEVGKTIWLEAFPRYQADAANFKKVEIIIGKDFMPVAIKMFNPAFDPARGNDSTTVFAFDNMSYNRAWDNLFGDFVEPPMPFGYKKIVLQPAMQNPPQRGPASAGSGPANVGGSARLPNRTTTTR